MPSAESVGSLLSAAGVGALLSKGLDWVMERRRKRDEASEEKTAAEIADNAAARGELWKRVENLEARDTQTQAELRKVSAENLVLLAEVAALQHEVVALRNTNSKQEAEIESLRETIVALSTENHTGKHPAVS